MKNLSITCINLISKKKLLKLTKKLKHSSQFMIRITLIIKNQIFNAFLNLEVLKKIKKF